ncbi:MAG: late competence development ComFB family protein [Alkalispirochaeta sp.]
MEIHNLMEELVASIVSEIAREDRASASPRYCGSEECRIDAVCYVLNRVEPRYVSSSRGYAHLTADLQKDRQLSVDLVRLAHEGLHRVTAVRRNYYHDGVTAGTEDSGSHPHPEGPCYNFPTIRGRLLDGTRFSPVTEVTVLLLRDEDPVEMFGERWTNPYEIPKQAPGTYNFWPAPIPAEHTGETREFTFEIRVTDGRFDPLSHYFTVSATSEEREERIFTLERDHTLPDLYLFER